jgi:hypothetical protein
MLIWRKTGLHLLVWMNVITEISQSVAEFLHIRLQKINLASNVYELSEAPLVKSFCAAVAGLWAGESPVEPRRFLLGGAKQNGLQNASTKEDHGKMRFCP